MACGPLMVTATITAWLTDDTQRLVPEYEWLKMQGVGPYGTAAKHGLPSVPVLLGARRSRLHWRFMAPKRIIVR